MPGRSLIGCIAVCVWDLAMSAVPKQVLSVSQFLDWSQSRRERYELQDGLAVALQSERASHRRAKASAFLALRDAFAKAGLPCHAEADGGTARITDKTAYRPDALVYCGEVLGDETLAVPNPVIVVEVLSPGSAERDLDGKLAGYFLVQSIQHYLIANPEARRLVHQARAGDGLHTRILHAGELSLDPPGLKVNVADLFG
jgi:Uma2 family endonuclease